MKIIAVIPARYSSTRLPGKPLLMINEKPMIYWVYQAAISVELFEKVIVATDDDRIVDACNLYDMESIMTSSSNQTGTDRVAEVASLVDSDYIVNIQGDEPLLEPENIKIAIDELINNKELSVVNLMQKITDPMTFINSTVPKVVTDNKNFGLFLSRSAIPYPKGSITSSTYKQVCVYAYNKSTLQLFKKTARSKNEIIEDIELLRFIDNGIKVKFVEVVTKSIAVDTMSDYKLVKKLFSKT